MSMNFILLLFAGGVVYGMVEYRAKKLTRDALEQLEDRQDMEVTAWLIRPVFLQLNSISKR